MVGSWKKKAAIMQNAQDFETEVVIIYRKTDGRLFRVSTLHDQIAGRITEDDIDLFLPGMDTEDFGMALVKGKQYLDIEKYRVETDVDGNFLNIVEATDVLSSFGAEEVQVNQELLDREPNIVISVLGVIDDLARLAKYKELEEQGQCRPEVLNFFKQKGIK